MMVGTLFKPNFSSQMTLPMWSTTIYVAETGPFVQYYIIIFVKGCHLPIDGGGTAVLYKNLSAVNTCLSVIG